MLLKPCSRQKKQTALTTEKAQQEPSQKPYKDKQQGWDYDGTVGNNRKWIANQGIVADIRGGGPGSPYLLEGLNSVKSWFNGSLFSKGVVRLV